MKAGAKHGGREGRTLIGFPLRHALKGASATLCVCVFCVFFRLTNVVCMSGVVASWPCSASDNFVRFSAVPSTSLKLPSGTVSVLGVWGTSSESFLDMLHAGDRERECHKFNNLINLLRFVMFPQHEDDNLSVEGREEGVGALKIFALYSRKLQVEHSLHSFMIHFKVVFFKFSDTFKFSNDTWVFLIFLN